MSNLITGSSIKSVAHLHIMDSGILNSLPAGGRAFNEREDEFSAKKVMDVDFLSCYGSALSKFEYPLGLPSVYANSSQDTTITLKEFLDSNEHELVDDFYTITISEKLNFSQTFLYSKIIDEEKLKKRIMDVFDEEDSDLNVDKNDTMAESVVLTRELINTVITSDTLKIIKSICSKTEKNSIYNCRVDMALFYKKSERVIDLNEYLSKLEVLLAKKENSFTYNQDTKSIHIPYVWSTIYHLF